MLWVGHRQGVVLHMKLLMWPALVFYCWELYTCVLMTAGGWGFGHALSVTLLASAAVQTAAVCAAAVAESLRCATPPSFPPHQSLQTSAIHRSPA